MQNPEKERGTRDRAFYFKEGGPLNFASFSNGGIYSKVFKYITLKKMKKIPPSQERYLDWKKKIRHSEIRKRQIWTCSCSHNSIPLWDHPVCWNYTECCLGKKRACNHVTKNCLIIHKYSSYFPERSLDRPKKEKSDHVYNHNNLSANCIMIIGQILNFSVLQIWTTGQH